MSMAPVVKIRDPRSGVTSRFKYLDSMGTVMRLPEGFEYANSISKRHHERALSGKPVKPDATRALHPGRKIGSIAGTYIDNLASRENWIQLCSNCAFKFNYKANHYFRESNQPFGGRCDGCRRPTFANDPCTMFIHEKYIGVTWEPR